MSFKYNPSICAEYKHSKYMCRIQTYVSKLHKNNTSRSHWEDNRKKRKKKHRKIEKD